MTSTPLPASLGNSRLISPLGDARCLLCCVFGDCRSYIVLEHFTTKQPQRATRKRLVKMSSYDPVEADDLITPAEFRESMRLVRLQIAVPISVLIALGANLVCALALKPGLGEHRRHRSCCICSLCKIDTQAD